MYKAVKVRPGLQWKPQNTGGARTIGWRAESMDWRQPKRECVLMAGELKPKLYHDYVLTFPC